MPLTSPAVRIPPLSSYSSLGHSQMAQGHEVVEPMRPGTEALPSHIVMSTARTVLPINKLLSSKPSCLMNDHCSGAKSKCFATCARTACASNFTRHLSQLAPTPSNSGFQRCFPCTADMSQGLPFVFSPTTGSRVHKETRQAASSALNESSTQHCRGKLSTATASLPRFNVRCGEGDATGRGFGHSYGFMGCQGETVSTSARVSNTVFT